MRKKLFFGLILIMFNVSLYAREIQIQVFDKDLDIPLQGVTVQIPSLAKTMLTNEEGKANLQVDDNLNRAVLFLSLVGYEARRFNLKQFDQLVRIEMYLQGVVEGEELVIEGKVQQKEEKVGASTSLGSEEVKSLAARGVVEDVLSAVKFLPGVAYSSGFGTNLSIRGSHSGEVAASWDGFIVRYPFYWGGIVSIFNPQIVDSMKFSSGYIPVKYGQAMSGFIDIQSVKAENGLRFHYNSATSTQEGYLQVPLSKKSGLVVGGRLTYLDFTAPLVKAVAGQDLFIPPYIRETHLKWFFKPTDQFEIFYNGFYGADGIGGKFGFNATEEEKAQDVWSKGSSRFEYNQHHAINFAGIKAAPTDKIFINWLGGYEFNFSQSVSESITEGEQNNQSFSFSGNSDHNEYNHSLQSRGDIDFALHEKLLLSAGASVIWDNASFENNASLYGLDPETMVYTKNTLNIEDPGYMRLSSGAFLNLDFKPLPKKLEMELGCRLDHFWSRHKSLSFNKDIDINSLPFVNPRFYLSYTPLREKGALKSLTGSLSSGLYSKESADVFQDGYTSEDLTARQQKVWSNILGLEFDLPENWKILAEGYYKYYFDRFYFDIDIVNNRINNYFDGIGHSTGFDLVLERKKSKYLDGSLTYSFNYARYKNPGSRQGTLSGFGSSGTGGDWFYPSYHRFHQLLLNCNIKPLSFFTISAIAGFTSGTPKKVYDKSATTAINNVPTEDGGTITIYQNEAKYSDTARNKFAFPLSVKFILHHYFKKSKLNFQLYFAWDNILDLFYNPNATEYFDIYSGEFKENPNMSSFPAPSLGMKISY